MRMLSQSIRGSSMADMEQIARMDKAFNFNWRNDALV